MVDTGQPEEIIYTAGGTAIQGNVEIVNGDFVGRDKVLQITSESSYDVHGLANPYLGLAPYTYNDRQKYGGREQIIREAVERLTSPNAPQALMFITGASGSGKSSFAQAGFAPALETYYREMVFKHAVFRPGKDPLLHLIDVLWRQLGLPRFTPQSWTSAAFGAFLKRETPSKQINVIVVDQFEETFTQSALDSRKTFFDLLSSLPPFVDIRTHIIATMRADYLPELFAIPALYEIAKRGIDLRVMSEDELSEAIQRPLQVIAPDGAKRFEPGLVERLAHDAAADAAYLPLLQVTLEELWRKGRLTSANYNNLVDAIKLRADRVLAFENYDQSVPTNPRSKTDQQALLDLLLDLVNVSLDDNARGDVRRSRLLTELERKTPARKRLIEILIEARLLSSGAASDGAMEVSLIHEALLTNWDQLHHAIADRRDVLRQRSRFELSLKEWQAENRADGYLLSGIHLAEARDLEQRGDIAMQNHDAKDLLQLSIQQAEAKQRQELAQKEALLVAQQGEIEAQRKRAEAEHRRAYVARIGTLIASILLVVALIATGFAFLKQREADAAAADAQQQKAEAITAKGVADANAAEAQRQQKISRSRELAAIALNQLSVDQERSLLISLAANDAAHTLEANDALRRSLRAFQVRSVLQRCPTSTSSDDIVLDLAYAFSDDGSKIAIFCNLPPKSVRVLEAASGKTLLTIPLAANTWFIYNLSFSADSSTLAYIERGQGGGSMVGNAVVWSVTRRQQLFVSATYGDYVRLSQDGTRLWFYSSDFGGGGSVNVYDIVGRTQLAVIPLQVEEWSQSLSENQIALRANLGENQIGIMSDTALAIYNMADLTKQELPLTEEQRVILLRNSPTAPNGLIGFITDQAINIRNFDNGGEVASLTIGTVWPWFVELSPDNSTLALVYDDRIELRSLQDPQSIRVLSGHEGAIGHIEFSQDSRLLISTSLDTTLRIWDVVTGQLQTTINKVFRATFTPNKRQLVLQTEDGNLVLWDVVNTGEVASLKLDYPVQQAWFSEDMQEIFVTSADSVIAWHWLQSEATQPLTSFMSSTVSPSPVKDSLCNEVDCRLDAISPNGRLKITIDAKNNMHVSDTATEKELFETSIGYDVVNDLQFSSDSTKLVIAFGSAFVREARGDPGWLPFRTLGDLDHTASIWDLQTMEQTAILRGHKDAVTSANFSSDSKYVVTTSDDGSVKVFLVDIKDLEALARQRIIRIPPELTCEERVQFLKEKLGCPSLIPSESGGGK